MNSKITTAKTRLQRNVQNWINTRAADYPDTGAKGVLEDLMHGGCSSGIVGHLIYTHDCVKFYRTHRAEINALLADTLDQLGEASPAALFNNPNCSQWDKEDPLALESGNQNLLAWFAFEETARNLAAAAGLDV